VIENSRALPYRLWMTVDFHLNENLLAGRVAQSSSHLRVRTFNVPHIMHFWLVPESLGTSCSTSLPIPACFRSFFFQTLAVPYRFVDEHNEFHQLPDYGESWSNAVKVVEIHCGSSEQAHLPNALMAFWRPATALPVFFLCNFHLLNQNLQQFCWRWDRAI